MGNIKTFLTFKTGGADAVEFYTSLIPNSKITSIYRHPGGGPLPEGALLNASFELDGQKFVAMDGGDHFSFAEGTSILVNVETQDDSIEYGTCLPRTEANPAGAAGLKIAGVCRGR